MSEFQAIGSRGRQKPSVRQLKSTVQYIQDLLSLFKIRYAISVLYNVDLSFKQEFVSTVHCKFTERYKSLNNQSSSSCDSVRQIAHSESRVPSHSQDSSAVSSPTLHTNTTIHSQPTKPLLEAPVPVEELQVTPSHVCPWHL
jgi:hypothetical protein